MGAKPDEPAALECWMAEAESLCRDCERLLELLMCLKEVPPEQFEDVHRARAAEGRAIRAHISAVAAGLGRRRAQFRRLPPGLRRQVQERFAECLCVLGKVHEEYEVLIGLVRGLMEAVRRRISHVRAGGRAVRSYARTSVASGKR